MLIDAHCHLNDEQFANDIDAVIAHAQSVGVQAIITAGANVTSSHAAVALAERYPNVYAVVGIHPEHAASLDDKNLAEICELAKHRKVVGIGEIGLDLYWQSNPPRDVQERAFIAQMELATELDKPVVIHNRAADEWLMQVLHRSNMPRGIMHCFSGNLAMARQAIDLGYLISFAGNVTFKNAKRLQEIAAALPIEKIIVETDAPYLSPLRGKRNEPANVMRVAEKIAELRRADASMIAETITRNSRALFRLDKSEDF